MVAYDPTFPNKGRTTDTESRSEERWLINVLAVTERMAAIY